MSPKNGKIPKVKPIFVEDSRYHKIIRLELRLQELS